MLKFVPAYFNRLFTQRKLQESTSYQYFDNLVSYNFIQERKISLKYFYLRALKHRCLHVLFFQIYTLSINTQSYIPDKPSIYAKPNKNFSSYSKPASLSKSCAVWRGRMYKQLSRPRQYPFSIFFYFFLIFFTNIPKIPYTSTPYTQ